MKTKRAFLVAPRKFEIRETELTLSDNQVLVKVAACGMCNSELPAWTGEENEPYPRTLGHEAAGVIVEIGKNVTRWKVGDKVACAAGGGYSEYITVPEANVFRLSENIDPKYGFGEPQRCILTVLRAAQPEVGDYGVMVGCGPMGLWCIMGLAGNSLAGLIAVDISDEKLELAKQYGATATINSAKENVVERLSELTDGHMADFVIEGTGIPALLNTAQDYVKASGWGRLVLMSSHGKPCPEFDFRKAIEKSIDIIIAHPKHTKNGLDDWRRAVNLINTGTFQIKPLISHSFCLENINEGFATLENKPADYKKGIICPNL